MTKFQTKGLRKRLTKEIPGQVTGSPLNPVVRDFVYASRAKRILVAAHEDISSTDVELLEQWWVTNYSKAIGGTCSFIVTVSTVTISWFWFPAKHSTLSLLLLFGAFAATALLSYLAFKLLARLVLSAKALPKLRENYRHR
jgi:hypothetical protein